MQWWWWWAIDDMVVMKMIYGYDAGGEFKTKGNIGCVKVRLIQRCVDGVTSELGWSRRRAHLKNKANTLLSCGARWVSYSRCCCWCWGCCCSLGSVAVGCRPRCPRCLLRRASCPSRRSRGCECACNPSRDRRSPTCRCLHRHTSPTKREKKRSMRLRIDHPFIHSFTHSFIHSPWAQSSNQMFCFCCSLLSLSWISFIHPQHSQTHVFCFFFGGEHPYCAFAFFCHCNSSIVDSCVLHFISFRFISNKSLSFFFFFLIFSFVLSFHSLLSFSFILSFCVRIPLKLIFSTHCNLIASINNEKKKNFFFLRTFWVRQTLDTHFANVQASSFWMGKKPGLHQHNGTF